VFAESASALLKYVRHGKIRTGDADDALAAIVSLPAEVVSSGLLARQALALAVTRRISAYDGCYLALAIGYDAVLVTADRRLAEAAERAALLPYDHPPLG
jgi:predicted nucleic acid-binding protein